MEADGAAPGRAGALTQGRRLAGALVGRHRMDLVAMALALASVAAFHYSGLAGGSRDALEFMGFDTDRAVLITAGLGAGLAGAVAALAGGTALSWVGSALLGLAALFQRTYLVETRRAVAGASGIGQFNPPGWLLTTAALVACAALLGLAAGILGAHARASIVRLWQSVGRAWRARSPRELPRASLLIAALVVAGLLIGVPVAGQLLNYGPDSLMFSGGPAGIPIVGEGGSGLPIPSLSGPTATPGAGRSPGASPPEPTPPVVVASRPWLRWRPSGAGTVVERSLPAPWTGGTSNIIRVWIYLPPGYQAGARRYPVVYEIPWPITLYDDGANIRPTLDALIDSGLVPATIFVFVSSGGGPFVDNECIDAAGGQENFDTFIGTTLVHVIDAGYRTIPTPDARTLMGSSQGGFCAANVLLHHPDVFRQEISFSGYYLAAPMLNVSPSAAAPYAGNTALERANSPMLIAPTLPPGQRAQLLLALVGNPLQPFYGNQMSRMADLGRLLGLQVAQIDTPYGHSWLAVRATLPSALMAVGFREAAEGVFGTS